MERALLLYNPKAGEEEDVRNELIRKITQTGLHCIHIPLEGDWLKAAADTDLIVVAGGDGTVRKVATELLYRQQLEKRVPLALLPLGTANNMAGALGVDTTITRQIQGWKKAAIHSLDAGSLRFAGGEGFFLEGAGYGVFPKLMKKMKFRTRKPDTPAEELQLALTALHGIIQEYDARYCRITVDEEVRDGEFLLVEVMNIRTIGPNLALAPEADPADGLLNVVLIPENDRADFAAAILDQLNGKQVRFPGERLKGRRVELEWDGRLLHMDDELLKPKKKKGVCFEIRPGVLDVLK